MTKYISPQTFVKDVEYSIFNIEGVRIVFRTSGYNQMYDYNFAEPIDDNVTINQWIKERIYPLITNTYNGNRFVDRIVQYTIIAHGEPVNDMSMTMKELRALTKKEGA